MSKYKNFIRQRKAAEVKKSVEAMPEQGSYITLYNNSYKVLTKPDAKISIIEDNRSNKIAYPREALVKMLNEKSETVEKAAVTLHGGPPTLLREVGQNAKSSGKPSASGGAGAAPAKPVDPVGTVRNGRKKVVSKKTGQTMWVNVSTGEGHAEHDSHESQELSKEAQAQAKSFFDSVGDSIHGSDKIKLERQMNDLMKLKQKIQNAMDMAHQDDRQKLPDAQMSRKQVFALQDQYKKAFKDFQSSVKESAGKAKKEAASE